MMDPNTISLEPQGKQTRSRVDLIHVFCQTVFASDGTASVLALMLFALLPEWALLLQRVAWLQVTCQIAGWILVIIGGMVVWLAFVGTPRWQRNWQRIVDFSACCLLGLIYLSGPDQGEQWYTVLATYPFVYWAMFALAAGLLLVVAITFPTALVLRRWVQVAEHVDLLAEVQQKAPDLFDALVVAGQEGKKSDMSYDEVAAISRPAIQFWANLEWGPTRRILVAALQGRDILRWLRVPGEKPLAEDLAREAQILAKIEDVLSQGLQGLTEQPDVEQAKQLYQAGLQRIREEMLQSRPAKTTEAHLLYRLGILAEGEGPAGRGDATRHYRESRALADQVQEPELEAYNLLRLADLARKGGGFRQARRLCQAALKNFERFGVYQGQIEALFSLVQVAETRGKQDEAARYQERLQKVAGLQEVHMLIEDSEEDHV